MRRLVVFAAVALSLATVVPASAGPAAVRLSADVVCLRSGGAHIAFTIENVGPRRVRIDPDFHLWLKVTRVGDDVGAVAFVFPAPGWDVIPAGQARTFQLDLGEAFEGQLGTDLSGLRLHLSSQVWLAGRPNPAVRTFSFPACAPPQGA
jgi:hypothetical protein